MEYIKLYMYQLCNTFPCTSKSQNIPHPVAGSVLWFTIIIIDSQIITFSAATTTLFHMSDSDILKASPAH